MPIPFIAAGIIAASAITGVGSGAKAMKNSSQAKGVNRDARGLVDKAEESLNQQRQLTNEQIEELGKKKIEILSSSVKEFINYFQLLKNVDFKDQTVGIEELKHIGVSKDLLKDLETGSFHAAKIASGGAASLGTGVAAAYGAYAGTMAFGTASTGAAISGLSGVAASNATLAWLGGGALSASGYGVAGGTLVLGGIVAGPALAVGGLIMSAQSKKKLNAAHENMSEAKMIAEQMKSAETVLTPIKGRAKKIRSLLTRVGDLFESGIISMRTIIVDKGTNWNDFNKDEKEEIHKVFLTAQFIKGIIDTPLLDEDGAITRKSAEVLKAGRKALKEINEKMM